MIRKIELFDKELIIFYRKSFKSNLTIPSELEDIIIGLILGDLQAEKINLNSNTRLQFKQSYKNKDYIDHYYSLFYLYCG
jgi:LAGLIDADG DNA endonuclease family